MPWSEILNRAGRFNHDKKRTVCIVSSPRSGTNYVSSFFSDEEYFYNDGEDMFSLEVPHTRSLFLMRIARLLLHGKLDQKTYVQIMCKLIEYESHTKAFKVPSNFFLDKIKLFKLFVKYCLPLNGRHFVFKYMDWWDQMGIKLHLLFPHIDDLLIVHRRDVLAKWISYTKAIQSQQWLNEQNNQQNQNILITWDKTQYMKFHNNELYFHNQHVEYWNTFPAHKNRCLFVYENIIDSQNPDSYIADLLQQSSINIPVSRQHKTYPQSQGYQQIQNNFINKEEYIKDMHEINKTRYIKESDFQNWKYAN